MWNLRYDGVFQVRSKRFDALDDTSRKPSSEKQTIQIRSVDGTVYRIVNDNSVDYFLHPLFLKFLVAACLLYGLMDQDRELTRLMGWLIWGQVIIVILVWLVVCNGITRLLFRQRLIQQIWTPIVLVPMILLLEATIHAAYVFAGLSPKPWDIILADVPRDIAIVLVFDFLHGLYVVPGHPHARIGVSSPAEDAKPASLPKDTSRSGVRALMTDPEVSIKTESPSPSASAPPTPPAPNPSRPKSVRIGTDSFELSDILMIRIEDHYLGVTTRSGRTLQRAKLAAIEDLHNGDIGIQINRSVWVAFWAIRDIQTAKNGQILLVLVNGDEELVAKPRLHAFRQAYRTATGKTL